MHVARVTQVMGVLSIPVTKPKGGSLQIDTEAQGVTSEAVVQGIHSA